MAKLTNFEDATPSTSTLKGNKGKGRAAPPPEAFPDGDDAGGDDDDDAPPEAVSSSKLKSALKKREKASKEVELEEARRRKSLNRIRDARLKHQAEESRRAKQIVTADGLGRPSKRAKTLKEVEGDEGGDGSWEDDDEEEEEEEEDDDEEGPTFKDDGGGDFGGEDDFDLMFGTPEGLEGEAGSEEDLDEDEEDEEISNGGKSEGYLDPTVFKSASLARAKAREAGAKKAVEREKEEKKGKRKRDEERLEPGGRKQVGSVIVQHILESDRYTPSTEASLPNKVSRSFVRDALFKKRKSKTLPAVVKSKTAKKTSTGAGSKKVELGNRRESASQAYSSAFGKFRKGPALGFATGKL